MRTLKLALAAVAAFAFNANAQQAITGMGIPLAASPNAAPKGVYQVWAQGTDIGNGSLQVFHGGGVAACDGCHVMHNAQYGVTKSTTGTGQSVQPWTNVTNAYLLQGSDQSSTCLICHGYAGASGVQFTVADTRTLTGTQAPTNYTPAGDFGWVGLTFTNSPGVRHGHNVVAADFPQFQADPLNHAPGGTFADSASGTKAFGCANCHDPHGRYRWTLDGAGAYVVQGPSAVGQTINPIVASGSYGAEPSATTAVGVYRILGGKGYAPASNAAYPFPNDPPIAVAPGTYNKSEAGGVSNQVQVAYATGMSEWCQNCHTNIHMDGYSTGVAGLRHPAGSKAMLKDAQAQIYNKYVSSGNINGTGNLYSSLVPFEQGLPTGANKFATLATRTVTSYAVTASTSSNVMCLSCHRAHASAFDSMLRWDQNATFLTGNAAFTSGLTNRDPLVTQAGYYGRAATDLGNYQRSLCNKCHGKD